MENLFVTVKLVQTSEVTQSDIDKFNELSNELDNELEYLVGVSATHFGIDKRIIRIDNLTLVNPTVVERKNPVIYLETDGRKPKLRKVLRYGYLKVNTDNLGQVEFKSDNDNWKNVDVLMTDGGLQEAVAVQRLIDGLDGIPNTSPLRRYDISVRSQKIPRNQKVMLQSPSGDMVFIKYKLADTYIDTGYKLM
jgi:hypothetical protein